mgnify:CR=1 FL=1
MRWLQQWIIKYLQDEAHTVRTVSSADFLVLGCTSVGIWSNKTKNEDFYYELNEEKLWHTF